MTGGPDGDLGSNEILMGSEKIVGVIDGSGVLYDPEGIEREPLVQLAKSRRMVQSFNGTLSPNGFLVLVSDENVKLPDGRVVESGLAFRNNFHLNEDVQADFFVPCGGRPESVNLQNVDKMFKKDGSPRFKYVVEGANLFFSEGARYLKITFLIFIGRNWKVQE
jgi:glutamate dehydrogenase